MRSRFLMIARLAQDGVTRLSQGIGVMREGNYLIDLAFPEVPAPAASERPSDTAPVVNPSP